MNKDQSKTTPNMGSMYSRQSARAAQQAHSNPTLVQGMNQPSTNDQSQPDAEIVHNGTINGRAVVGFLYSMSRGVPEYWPLHLGANKIGRGNDCDVQLKEMSVSKEHASINVKQMKSTGRLIANIRDIGSQTGLYLNDEELDYDGHTCKNLDVIVIGNSYKLLLMLVDSKEHGLEKADNFVPDVSIEKQEEMPTPKSIHDKVGRKHYPLDSTQDLDGIRYDDSKETKVMG